MKFLRKILFPVAFIYWGITLLRNTFYDIGWLKSTLYDFPVICVGNLSTGGTGKSPMTEFLIRNLKDKKRIGILSRGYKRKTTGFKEVYETSTVAEVGDEPLQFKRKFPSVTVAVCEDRRKGIEMLKSAVDVLVLDDAFQHRKVRPGYAVLLTSYGDLYVDDYPLPMGDLREPKCGAKRADVIVVTKCPKKISRAEMSDIKQKINPAANQEVFFATIGYSDRILDKASSIPLTYLAEKDLLLVTGIANPKPLVDHLYSMGLNFTHKAFGDHHNFSAAEVAELQKASLILTTEKDYMRLEPFVTQAELFYIPISTEFIDGRANEFLEGIPLE